MYCALLLFLMKDIFPPVQAPSTYFRWFPASVRTVLCVLSLSVTNPFFCLPASYPILSISNYIMFFTFQVNLYIYNDIFHLVPAILPAGELFLYHHVSLKSYSTSKGKQHDIVSISRCFHLEHLLLFYFLVFVFYIALSVSTNRSNLSLLICTRFPFHNRYSAFGFSLTNLWSFPSPIRKYAAASSIDNVYLFHMNQAWIQLRAQKQFITTASDFLFYALI